MPYLLEVEFVDSAPEQRLVLYRQSLLQQAQNQQTPLILRAVGSGWDAVDKTPTQQRALSAPVFLHIARFTSARLQLLVDDWPDEAPLGELMQFSLGDGAGELRVWARALSFKHVRGQAKRELDAKG